MGDGVGQVTSGENLTTVRSAVAALGAYTSSPANVALTAPGYVPPLRPIRLTSAIVATTKASVAAVPACDPLSVKLTSRPARGSDADVKVAVSVAVPP